MRGGPAIFLAAIVIVSACVAPGIPSLAPRETRVETRDLLQLAEPQVFPSTQLKASEIFEVSLTIKNIGQTAASFKPHRTGDPGKGTAILQAIKGEDGKLTLCGVYELLDFNSFPQPKTAETMTIGPGQENTLSWRIRAPSAQNLAVPQPCDLKFILEYESDALTTTYIYFANPVELAQRRYTAQELVLRGDNVATFGPVVVNFETPDQPVAAIEGQKFTVHFNIKNEGGGTAQASNFKVQISSADIKVAQPSDCSLTYNAADSTLTVPPESQELLRVIGGSSSRFTCALTAPKVAILTPFRFDASANYTYTLEKALRIETEAVPPFLRERAPAAPAEEQPTTPTAPTAPTVQTLPGPCTPGTFKCENDKAWLCNDTPNEWRLSSDCGAQGKSCVFENNAAFCRR